jgi:hypothetical protein
VAVGEIRERCSPEQLQMMRCAFDESQPNLLISINQGIVELKDMSVHKYLLSY